MDQFAVECAGVLQNVAHLVHQLLYKVPDCNPGMLDLLWFIRR